MAFVPEAPQVGHAFVCPVAHSQPLPISLPPGVADTNSSRRRHPCQYRNLVDIATGNRRGCPMSFDFIGDATLPVPLARGYGGGAS